MTEPVCPTCHPELVPGPGDLSLSDPYRGVTLNGSFMGRVTKAQSGPDGWVFQAALRKAASGHNRYRLCPNGPHLLQRLIRGQVQYQRYPITIPAAGTQNQES